MDAKLASYTHLYVVSVISTCKIRHIDNWVYFCYNDVMSKGVINFSKDNEWYTPPNLVRMFGPFDYDPATTPERAKILDIPNYDTEETDGLKSDWTKYKRIWINPPFTKKKEFWQKAWSTYWKVYNELYFLCPIAWLTTKQFHDSFGGGGYIFAE